MGPAATSFAKGSAKGKFSVAKRVLAAAGLGKGKVLVEQIVAPGKTKASKALASRGLPYALKGWGSGVYRISAAE